MEYVASTDAVRAGRSTGREELRIEVSDDGKQVIIDGQVRNVDMQDVGNHALFSLLVDDCSYELLIEEVEEGFRVLLEGRLYTVRVDTRGRQRLSSLVSRRPPPSAGGAAIRAPMPGLVVSVPMRAGEAVSAGQVLIVLESMKMENEVRAPQDGMIQVLNVAAGDLVNANQVLLVLG